MLKETGAVSKKEALEIRTREKTYESKIKKLEMQNLERNYLKSTWKIVAYYQAEMKF